jgi:hypothetical protein
VQPTHEQTVPGAPRIVRVGDVNHIEPWVRAVRSHADLTVVVGIEAARALHRPDLKTARTWVWLHHGASLSGDDIALLRSVDRVFCPDVDDVDAMMALLPAHKVSRVPLAIDRSVFAQPSIDLGVGPLGIFGGRARVEERAIADDVLARIDASSAVVFGWPGPSSRALARSGAGVVDARTRRETARVLSRCSLVVIPQKHPHLSHRVLETLSCGRPAVVVYSDGPRGAPPLLTRVPCVAQSDLASLSSTVDRVRSVPIATSSLLQRLLEEHDTTDTLRMLRFLLSTALLPARSGRTSRIPIVEETAIDTTPHRTSSTSLPPDAAPPSRPDAKRVMRAMLATHAGAAEEQTHVETDRTRSDSAASSRVKSTAKKRQKRAPRT